MGFFSDLFNRRQLRFLDDLANPLVRMKMREFVIADDDPVYMKHYFRFTNKDGRDEEFVVVYGASIRRCSICARTKSSAKTSTSQPVRERTMVRIDLLPDRTRRAPLGQNPADAGTFRVEGIRRRSEGSEVAAADQDGAVTRRRAALRIRSRDDRRRRAEPRAGAAAVREAAAEDIGRLHPMGDFDRKVQRGRQSLRVHGACRTRELHEVRRQMPAHSG